MNYETLAFGLGEVKFAPDSDTTLQFTGHGAVFNNIDAGGDLIVPGAFAAYLADAKAGKQPWPAMLSQHGGMMLTAADMTPVGVWTDIVEDGHGLKVIGKFADTPRGMELYKLSKMEPRPAISGMSIGYIAKEWEPRTKPDDPRRKLKRIDLREISLVTFPMNDKARVTDVKNELTKRTAERALRDAGFSQSEAKRIVSAGFNTSTTQRDVGGLGDIAAALRRNIHTLTP